MTIHQRALAADDLAGWFVKARREPAPEYRHDETGVAQQAMNVREWKRRMEWYEELNDEIPY